MDDEKPRHYGTDPGPPETLVELTDEGDGTYSMTAVIVDEDEDEVEDGR